MESYNNIGCISVAAQQGKLQNAWYRVPTNRGEIMMSRNSHSSRSLASSRSSGGEYLKTAVHEEEDYVTPLRAPSQKPKPVTPPKMPSLKKLSDVMQRTARYKSGHLRRDERSRTIIQRKKHKNVKMNKTPEDTLENEDYDELVNNFFTEVDKEFDEKYSAEDEDFHNPQIKFFEKYDDLSQNVYINICRKLNEVPASYFLRNLVNSEIVMRSHGLGPTGCRACAVALVNNAKVQQLDLHGNMLGEEGASYIADMLRDNLFITDLTLSENNLGSEGAKVMAYIMKTNHTINRLDLSGNKFQEKDALYIAQILQENYTLKELYLSHNEFQEKGGEFLKPAIAENDTLTILDLSWNHLRRRGAKSICEGVSENSSLEQLNLSWNGFHMDGSIAMSKALAKNQTLTALNLECNRIDFECLKELLKGLRKNSSLESLNLGKNPISTEGAILMIQTIQKNDDMIISSLDITGQSVDKEFMTSLLSLQTKRSIRVEHGIVMRQDETESADSRGMHIDDDPMIVLMEFMRIKNLRLVDLFKALDADGSGTLTREEFRLGLLSVNIPLSERALNKLIDKLDADGDGEVDYSELIAGQKEHRRKVSQIALKAKRSNTPMDQTVVGRVSSKIKTILALREAQQAAAVTDASQTRRQSMKVSSSHERKITDTQSEISVLSSKSHPEANVMRTSGFNKNGINLRALSAAAPSSAFQRKSEPNVSRPWSANIT